MKTKNIRIIILVVSFINLPLGYLLGQEKLQVGSLMPNISLGKMINNDGKKNVSDYKGKFLILDFWATWCGPCVAMFPRTDSLEKELNGKLEFLGVSTQEKEKVEAFLSGMQKTTKVKLKTVVEDSAIQKLFPSTTYPCYVWIDNKGKIYAITDQKEITLKNLNNFIEGKGTSLNQKLISENYVIDLKPAFYQTIHFLDDKKNIDNRAEINNDEIYFHSIFSKALPNVAGIMQFEKNKFTAINTGPILLLRVFYGIQKKYGGQFGTFLAKGKTEIKVKDSLTNYRLNGGPKYDSLSEIEMKKWGDENGICYESTYPERLPSERKNEIIERDLKMYFQDIYNVDFSIQQKKIKAYALTQINSSKQIDLVKTKGGTSYFSTNTYNIKLVNIAFIHFINTLTQAFRDTNFPVINKTGITENVDLEINCDVKDVSALNKELAKYGLILNLQDVETDVLVIEELNGENSLSKKD